MTKEQFFNTVLPVATSEQMVNGFQQIVKEANEDSKKMAIIDPIAKYSKPYFK